MFIIKLYFLSEYMVGDVKKRMLGKIVDDDILNC